MEIAKTALPAKQTVLSVMLPGWVAHARDRTVAAFTLAKAIDGAMARCCTQTYDMNVNESVIGRQRWKHDDYIILHAGGHGIAMSEGQCDEQVSNESRVLPVFICCCPFAYKQTQVSSHIVGGKTRHPNVDAVPRSYTSSARIHVIRFASPHIDIESHEPNFQDMQWTQRFQVFSLHSGAHFGAESPSRRCPSHRIEKHSRSTFPAFILRLQPRSTYRARIFGATTMTSKPAFFFHGPFSGCLGCYRQLATGDLPASPI